MLLASQSNEVLNVSGNETSDVLEQESNAANVLENLSENVLTESYTEYQTEVINQLKVSNEFLYRISIFQIFLFGFLLFEFVYRLIRNNITNHF